MTKNKNSFLSYELYFVVKFGSIINLINWALLNWNRKKAGRFQKWPAAQKMATWGRNNEFFTTWSQSAVKGQTVHHQSLQQLLWIRDLSQRIQSKGSDNLFGFHEFKQITLNVNGDKIPTTTQTCCSSVIRKQSIMGHFESIWGSSAGNLLSDR